MPSGPSRFCKKFVCGVKVATNSAGVAAVVEAASPAVKPLILPLVGSVNVANVVPSGDSSWNGLNSGFYTRIPASSKA